MGTFLDCILEISIKYPNTLLYFIFKELKPVFSFSLALNLASHCLPFRLISISSSNSLLNPSLIIPPSVMVEGESSLMEFSINLTTLSNVILSGYLKNTQSSCFNNITILGRQLSEDLRARKSRALHCPMEILLTSRSRSKTLRKVILNSSNICDLFLSSSTAFNLSIIKSFFNSGYLNHFLRTLPPMAVTVLSITLNNVPFFEPVLKFLIISRLRQLTSSNCI